MGILSFDIMKGLIKYSFAFLAVSFVLPKLSVGQSVSDLIVNGPTHSIFLGDKENFSCSALSSVYQSNLQWKFELKDGSFEVIKQSDTEDYNNMEDDKPDVFVRSSYIRISKADISHVICSATTSQSSEERNESFSIKITELPVVPISSNNLCDNLHSSPSIILERYNSDFTSRFWVPHYVNNTKVKLQERVSSLKLTCISNQRVDWIVEKVPERFKYLTMKTEENCHKAVLEISPIAVNSSQTYTCRSNETKRYKSFVEIDASDVKMPKDVPEIEQCINHIIDIITGNSSSPGLTGLSIGSSLMTLGMLVGIVYLKRQLNQQKEIGTELTTNSPPRSS